MPSGSHIQDASCLRDGRLLKRERKVKNVMALSRFLQKKNGLYGQQDKLTLQELGLSELAPTHSHRLGHVRAMISGKPVLTSFLGGWLATSSIVTGGGVQQSCTRTVSWEM